NTSANPRIRATSSAPHFASPVELRARLDDIGIVFQPLALAVDLHVVQHELEVGSPVPVHAGGPGVHPAAFHGAIVEIDGVVTQAQLPHAAAGVGGLGRGRHAALVAPGLAGNVPQALHVGGGAGVVAAGQALDAAAEVFALQLERAADPQRFEAGGGDAVGVGHAAGVDQTHRGQVRVGTCAQAEGIGVGVVVHVRQA